MRTAERISRLGTETAFEVLARANALAAQGHSIINLGIGQPDFPTPENIVEAVRRALADGHHGYTPANGIPPLREAVAADILARRGVEIHPDRVVVVPGGKVTMFFAMMMFGERLAAGFDDVRRRRKIGLADAEVDDVAALGGQRIGARQHFEGAFGAEARHPRGELHGAVMPLFGVCRQWRLTAIPRLPFPRASRGKFRQLQGSSASKAKPKQYTCQ